jgi:PAS domain S-box-containing protein
MLAPWFVSAVALGYLGLLFAIAFYGDRRAPRWRGGAREPVIYALSLAIYCTSWTFYGSVGRAASHGIDFILIYVGPILLMLPGYPVMRKIVSIARAHNVTSIADFIGARYGKSRPVAALATVIAVVGVLPYIALQLQAVTLSFDVLVAVPAGATGSERALPIWRDTALYVALMMAAFSILFGVRHVHASERHHGMILAIAFESLVKLGAFLAVGLFVVFGLFEGPVELARRVTSEPGIAARLEAIDFQPAWLSITLLAAFAFICLPRQFHVAVVESGRPANLRMAAWLFPLYLVATNLFVPAIAAVGLLQFPEGTPPDLFVLMLPIAGNESLLSLAAFIGGLSASTSMVIVEGVALSTMICNELVMPVLLRRPALRTATGGAMGGLLLSIRRSAIFIVLIAAYGYHAVIGDRYPLASIGLISFCAVAQFGPALLIGLYWRGAHRHGALAGMAAGGLVWAYSLLLPSLSEAGWLPTDSILGGGSLPAIVAGLDPLTNGAVWSLLVNVALLVGTSLVARQREHDRQQAEAFVAGEMPIDPAHPGSAGHAPTFEDLKSLAARFLGRDRAEQAFAGSIAAYREKDLAAFTERLLSGAIGAASARIVVAAVLRRRWASMRATRAMLDEASEAILFNRDLLRATLENVSQGIGMFDPGLRLAAWNRRFLELLGVPEELAQMGTSLMLIVESPQRLGSAMSVDLALLLEAQTDPARSVEPHTYERRRDDGRVLELQTNPMPAGGFVLVCTDITERTQTLEALRDSERHIRIYTNNVPVLIAYVDRRERYRFTNQPYEHALGLRQGGMLGLTIREVLGEDRYQRLKPNIDAAFAGERQTFEIEFPDGGVKLARGTYIPHLDDAGGVIGFVALYQDITEQRRAENVLREANEMLERRVIERTRELTQLNAQLTEAKATAEAANVGKTRFLAAASHDLLQPLHAARLFTGALAERSRSPKIGTLVGQLDQALGAVDELLQALLDISKLDAGALRPRPRSLVVGEVLRSVAASFEPMARKRGLRLRVLDSRAIVVTDPALLRRVLQNFLSNAIRYTRRGAVLIGCRRRGERVDVEVWDTGPGIPETQLGVIFEECKRLGGPDGEAPAGLGLGLAIVDRIARMLDHPVRVRSWPGKGSVFSVNLPVGTAVPLLAVPVAERRIPDSLPGKNVLCIDNDVSVLAAMRTLLEGWSCTAITASDLAGALRELRGSALTPDIVLADHHLGGGQTGIAALEALNAHLGMRPPAILITADYSQAVRDAAQASGYPLLNKPLRPAALRALMAHLLTETRGRRGGLAERHGGDPQRAAITR